ncbi:hypothetical protein DPMN_177150 [Dreissena polymorpha]|uniref:Uncharacterized protein n=1 Tax=Dreissena polymorpha TaxID=45954 RepID=A0A9D4IJY2_DREPO|nr:hypothetical protein DPMN_177150 [Dreissena polymorpha]
MVQPELKSFFCKFRGSLEGDGGQIQSLLPLAADILASDSHSNFVSDVFWRTCTPSPELSTPDKGTTDMCLKASDKATKRRRLFWSTEAPKKPVVTEEQEEEMEYSYGKEDSAVCDHCTSDEQGFHW